MSACASCGHENPPDGRFCGQCGGALVDGAQSTPVPPGTVFDSKYEVKQEIVILQKVFFDFNEATIRPESHKVLDAVAHILDANPHVERVEVQGHTDARGTVEYNLQLSQDRAESVRSYLVRKGVAADRLTARGYGKSQPIAEGDSDEVHDQNRRVQFVILEQE